MNHDQDAIAGAKVTVVIPVWGRYVSQELDVVVQSAKAASQHPVRVVVVDNAHEHAVSIPGAEILRSATRLSLGEVRNLGLSVVATEWVVFLDADDLLLPGGVDRLLEVAGKACSRHGRPLAVVTAPLAHRGTTGRYHWPTPWMRQLSRRQTVFRILEAVRAAFPLNGALIRTEVAVDGPGFDPHPAAAEDWVFGVSLTWRGRVVFAPEPAMSYAPTVAGQWSQHRSLPSQRKQQACVRRRLLHEPSVPRWVKSVLPVLWLVHQLDLLRVWREHRRLRVAGVT